MAGIYGQDLSGALVKVMTAQSNMVAYRAVVEGTAEGTCTGPGAANAEGFLGFLLNDVTSGSTVAVHMAGGIALGIAGASVTAQSFAIIEGTDGRLANFVATNTNRFVVCKVLRAGVDGDVVPVLPTQFIGNLP